MTTAMVHRLEMWPSPRLPLAARVLEPSHRHPLRISADPMFLWRAPLSSSFVADKEMKAQEIKYFTHVSKVDCQVVGWTLIPRGVMEAKKTGGSQARDRGHGHS